MKIDSSKILTELEKLPLRHKIVLVILIIFVCCYAMYSLILGPYISKYNAVKMELASYEQLLNNKLNRTKAIGKLKEVNMEYAGILSEVNAPIYSETEADLFLKNLPNIIEGFGNKVLSIKPMSSSSELSRSVLFQQMMMGLPGKIKEEGLAYIKNNRAEIDSGKQDRFHIQSLSKITRNRNQVMRTWARAKNNDLAYYYLDKKTYNILLQGNFYSFLDSLNWMRLKKKILNISDFSIKSSAKNAEVLDVEFNFYLYVATEQFDKEKESPLEEVTSDE